MRAQKILQTFGAEPLIGGGGRSRASLSALVFIIDLCPIPL
jgi:hypothetical protein